MILAAGLGSRLGKVTRSTPKALIKVNGISILERLMSQCVQNGVVRFTIVTGYMASAIEEAVKLMNLDCEVDFLHNADYGSTNNIVSLELAFNHLSKSGFGASNLLLLECDVLVDNDAFAELCAASGTNVALVSPFDVGMDGTVVRLDHEGFVSEFISGTKQGPDFDYGSTFKTVNLYQMNSALWHGKLKDLLSWYIKSHGSSGYYENVIGMAAYASGLELLGMVISPTSWSEIDDRNDLRIAEFRFLEGKRDHFYSRSHGGYWDFDAIDFSYLRNMYFPPPALIAQLRKQMLPALQNYGSSQIILDQKMSWWLDANSEDVVALPGLASIYPHLQSEFDNEGTLIPQPTFGEYPGRFPRAKVYPESLKIESLKKAFLEYQVLSTVVIVNPNNPSGELRSSQELLDLARSFPEVLFIIDESFLPFSDETSLLTMAEDADDNILVLASLSKNMGVPGLRIGYAWSKNRSLIAKIRRAQPVWGLSSVAEIFLTLALKFKKDYITSLSQSASDKAEFEILLAEVPGSNVVPRVAGNFALVEFRSIKGHGISEFCEAMLRRKILVKEVSAKLNVEHMVLRVAVRLPEENLKFQEALIEVLEDFGNKG